MDLVETNFCVWNGQVLIYTGLRNNNFLYWNLIQNSVYLLFIQETVLYMVCFRQVSLYMWRKTRNTRQLDSSKMTEL